MLKMTRKSLLIASGGVSLLMCVILFFDPGQLCKSVATVCTAWTDQVLEILIPVFVFFLISLATYKIRDSVYTAWFNFAKWWVPLSMLAILISPEYSNDWMLPIEKGSVAFVTSVLFVAISICILVFTTLRTAAKK